MGGRRTAPLIAVFVLAAGVLVLRLFHLGILQHRVWANEAANLVRASRVVPYNRGRLLDAEGVELVRDQPAYRLVFRYRDFRRRHPVGEVAHAWSALLARPVSLGEALANLESWAAELVQLSPSDVAAFGRGAGLSTWRFSLAPLDEPNDLRLATRARRASDVSFYAMSLLELDWRERGRLRQVLREEQRLPPLVELAAEWRGVAAEALLADLSRRLADSRRALERLEARLADALGPARSSASGAPGAALVALLEERRRGVEDAIAAKLFAETAGFAPGRLAPELLARIDLGFLAHDLDWDEARTADWVARAHVEWCADWRDGFALERLLAAIQGEGGWEEQPERALSLLLAAFEPEEDLEAALDGEPRDWREVRELAVLDRLHDAFERGGDAFDARRAGVPALLAGAEDAPLEARAAWALLESAVPRAEPAATTMDELLAQHRLHAGGRSARLLRERLRVLAGELFATFDAELQQAIGAEIDALARPGEPLAFARERLKRRNQKHWVKDYGSRPLPLSETPDYEAVYLLTRYKGDYPGFDVEDTHTRVTLVPEEAVDGELPAARLVGGVTRVDARDIQEQRPLRREVEELRKNAQRSDVEEAELRERVAELRLADEVKGASGVELGWDAELRGRNGFREYLSLEDLYGAGQGEDRLRPPEDGADVRLTLVSAVQLAAERTLAEPRRPEPGRDEYADDESWFDHPVGAIVLLTVEGDVIAAASRALADGSGDDPRGRDVDRTLQKPAFQPPGSVFKPFVAAAALDHGLDPSDTVECVPGADGWAEYKGLRCWQRHGHGGGIDLESALLGSCNVYFAHLGEWLEMADLRAAAQAFGFGQPTGVRGADGRPGPLEHHVPELFAQDLNAGLRMRAANGLSVVEVTPMQLARATAGLATGLLPAVRIVSAIGGASVPREPAQPVPLAPASLARVRRALVGVANDGRGTASRVLSEPDLDIGLSVAVKTGSADLFARSEEAGSKHAWVAGWIPAEDPLAVFVVLCDTTDHTSSHSAVYVARQFLQSAAVRAWIEARRAGP